MIAIKGYEIPKKCVWDCPFCNGEGGACELSDVRTSDIERPSDCPLIEIKENNWIPVTKRLPEEKLNPITQDYYEYQCTFYLNDIYDVRSYKFGKGHWWYGAGTMDDCVIAWLPRPEPYRCN